MKRQRRLSDGYSFAGFRAMETGGRFGSCCCKPDNKISLGFVEGLNDKIRVFQRRACGLRDEEYLRLNVLTCRLPRY